MEVELTDPQSEFFLLTDKFPLFIGGFGSGKTETLIINVLNDLISFPGVDVAVYSPTYDLMKLNLMPRLCAYLDAMGYFYGVNNSLYTFEVAGFGKIICRSLDNPQRIIAYEVFRSHVDEIDTLPQKKATEAWNKIIARNRQKHSSGAINRVSAYTTPEGFAFTYQRWKKEPAEGYKYIKAPTYSNPHLPDDYVDSLRATYPANLVDAYIEGNWVNLTQGAVFPEFDRVLNGTHAVLDDIYLDKPGKTEQILIGQDFNIGKQFSVIYVRRGNSMYAIDEIVNGFDTTQTLQVVKDRYPRHNIVFMPDASGKHRSSYSGSLSDFTLIREAKYRIDSPIGNPGVKDRLNAMNAKICNSKGERTFFVNVAMCPEFTASLEQITFNDAGAMDKSNDLDHPVDAGTYPIHRLFPIERRSAKEVKVVGLY